jgi:hypothetical protein
MPDATRLRHAACLVLFGATSAQAALPVPLQLVAVDSVGSESADASLPTQGLIVPVTALRLHFSAEVLASATHFRLVAAGPDQANDTAACAAIAADDDLALPIPAIQSGPDGREITLMLDTVRGLAAGRYRLSVCDSLPTAGAPALDGDGDGLPGGHAWREFEIAESPQLDNPNFNDGLDGWTVVGNGDFTVTPASDDADGSAHSGSVRITGRGGATVLLASDTCVQVGSGRAPGIVDYRARLRYRALSGRVALTALVNTGFAGDLGEPDCIGPGVGAQHALRFAQPAAVFGVLDSGPRELPSFPHATLTLAIGSPDGEFEVLVDDVGLTFDRDIVFRSRFDEPPPF